MNPEHVSALLFIAESILFKTDYDAGQKLHLHAKNPKLTKIVQYLKLPIITHYMS